MFKNIRKTIESNRNSKKILWKVLVTIKDFIWNLFNFFTRKLYYGILNILLRQKPGKLPDFIIIGAQKSGTTYLWKMLKKHPQIQMSPNFYETKYKIYNSKEVHFFNNYKKFAKGVSWYKSLFNNNEKLQGEATPSYFDNEIVISRMFNVIPDAKLILLIRNPITRAYSEFNHMRQIEKAWGEYDINKSFRENIFSDIESNFTMGTLITKGFYIEKIKIILKYYPRNQLLILISEQMKKDPEKVYKQVCQFLGIPYTNIDFEEKIHIRNYDKKNDKESEKTLYNIYDQYNKKLYDFLGYEIKEWEEEKVSELN